jgi:hypothetical protein
MEQEKVIKPGLAIWVTEYNLYKPSPQVWKVDGIALDAYHGFGDDETRYFDGQVVLLSLEKKLIQHVSISRIHFSREGFKWLLEETEHLLQPPFLISSNLATQIIFNGNVEISEDREDVDFSIADDLLYPIGTRDWFGILKRKGNKKAHLIAFSPNKDVVVLPEDELWSFDWDCSICKIRISQEMEYIR